MAQYTTDAEEQTRKDTMCIEDEWYVEMLKHQHDADVSIEGLRSEETDVEEQLRKEASGEIC